MKKRLLGFVLCIMLTSICVGCRSENTSAKQSEAVATTEESTPEQTVETTEASENAKESLLETNTEPAKAPAEKSTPEQAEMPSEETTTEPAESSSPKTNTEPVPEPQPIYTYTNMTATMYATQTVNIRNLPNTDGEKIGSLSSAQEVAVIGQCNETGWYMFDYNGTVAFVSNSYLSTEKIAVVPSASDVPTATATSETFPYELYVMYYDNMGYPYYYYIGLNALYISAEDEAKRRAIDDEFSNYVFNHFENPVYDPVTNTTIGCSFNPYWWPVGYDTPDGKPIYVMFVEECNSVILPSSAERGIFTGGARK